MNSLEDLFAAVLDLCPLAEPTRAEVRDEMRALGLTRYEDLTDSDIVRISDAVEDGASE